MMVTGAGVSDEEHKREKADFWIWCLTIAFRKSFYGLIFLQIDLIYIQYISFLCYLFVDIMLNSQLI